MEVATAAQPTKPAPAIIILGMPRSGTTLLKEMLDHHPTVAIPPESYFLPSLWRRYRIRRDARQLLRDLAALPQLALWGVDPETLRRGVAPGASFGDVIGALYGAYAAGRGKARYGDKTPAYVEDLGILEHAFPGAQYLHIVRDGRDAALSHEEMHGRSPRGLAFPRSLTDYACRWRLSVTRVRRFGADRGEGRYLEVRYERLVTEPEVVLREICGFLGLGYDREMLAYHRDASRVARPAHARLAEPPSLGKRDWRKQMPSAALQRFEALAGDALSELGYERSVASASTRVRMRASVDRLGSAARVGCWRAIAWVGPLTPLWRAYQAVRFRRENARDEARAPATSSLRVLLYAIDFAPLIGGEERYLLRLGTELSRGVGPRPRVAVTLLTRTPADGWNDSALPFTVLRRPGLAALWRGLGDADVLHVSGPVLLPLLLGRLRGKPTVVTHHTHHAACPNGLLFHRPSGSICPGHFRAGRFAECVRCNARSRGWTRSLGDLLLTFPRRWLCARAGVNLVVSRAASEVLALPRSTTVYHGIAAGSVRPAPSNATSCFAYVGRLVPEKGVPLLLRAAAQVRADGRACRVKVIGDGPDRAALEQLARRLEIDRWVEFVGFLSGSELEMALDDVTAVVVPSVLLEPAGLVVIEHMARGGVVIAARAGGLDEMLGDAGMTFPPGDADALADCLRRVLEDPNLAIGFAAAAATRARHVFQGEHDIEAHVAAYERLASRR